MFSFALHAIAGDRPCFRGDVDFIPHGADNLSGAGGGEDEEFKR